MPRRLQADGLTLSQDEQVLPHITATGTLVLPCTIPHRKPLYNLQASTASRYGCHPVAAQCLWVSCDGRAVPAAPSPALLRPQTHLPKPNHCTCTFLPTSPMSRPLSPRAKRSWLPTARRNGTAAPRPTAAGPRCTAHGWRRLRVPGLTVLWALRRRNVVVVVATVSVTALWLCCFSGWRPLRGSCR